MPLALAWQEYEKERGGGKAGSRETNRCLGCNRGEEEEEEEGKCLAGLQERLGGRKTRAERSPEEDSLAGVVDTPGQTIEQGGN